MKTILYLRSLLGAAMRITLNRKAVLCLVLALFTVLAIPVARAQQSHNLDKRARKIEKKLAKLRAGSYVDIDLRNGSESLGALGSRTDATFQITDADNNKSETFAYNDVARVRKGTAYIGQGSEPGHHSLHLVPLIIGAAAVAAGVATYEALR
jgi:hypothetical protein